MRCTLLTRVSEWILIEITSEIEVGCVAEEDGREHLAHVHRDDAEPISLGCAGLLDQRAVDTGCGIDGDGRVSFHLKPSVSGLFGSVHRAPYSPKRDAAGTIQHKRVLTDR